MTSLARKQRITVQRLTQDAVSDMGSLLLSNSINALQQVIRDPATPALKVWMAAVALKGIKNGDAMRLNQLLDRIVGKVKDRIEVSTDGNPIELRMMTISRDERIAQIERLRELRLAAGDD